LVDRTLFLVLLQEPVQNPVQGLLLVLDLNLAHQLRLALFQVPALVMMPLVPVPVPATFAQ
jgi:hypothetical protein